MAKPLPYTPTPAPDTAAADEWAQLLAALHDSGLLRALTAFTRTYPDLLGRLLQALDADTLRSLIALSGAVSGLDPQASQRLAHGVRHARQAAGAAAEAGPVGPIGLLRQLSDPDLRRGIGAALAAASALGLPSVALRAIGHNRPVPVTVPLLMPARAVLESENVFVISQVRAGRQDIRPLRIAILNLMPTKMATETQLLRLLGNTPLQVEIEMLHMSSHQSRNTPPEHLQAFYTTFDQVRHRKFDGLVITGAPVERLDFEEVDYWPELRDIMDWSQENVFSTLHVCWGAQAGLYHHFGVPKYPLQQKVFGVFPHAVLDPRSRLLSGFDEVFPAPHSRHTETRAADVRATPGLQLLAESPQAGVYLVASQDERQVFVTGHPEYERDTLKLEYERDRSAGLPIDLPVGYFPGDDPTRPPAMTWRSHAFLLYANWLNHYVYQRTPFDAGAIPHAQATDD